MGTARDVRRAADDAAGLAGGDERLRLALLGSFRLNRDETEVGLPTGAKRLVAYVALRPPGTRLDLAASLWPEADEQRALGNLRTAIWRVQRTVADLLDVDNGHMTIATGMRLDVRVVIGRARVLLAAPERLPLEDLYDDLDQGELLPGWYDDWVLLERERLRQLRLHALERAAQELSRRGHHGQALDIALSVVGLEPLRESGHAAVLRIHLAEGNVREALSHFEAYRALLQAELGISPAPQLTALLHDRLSVAMTLPGGGPRRLPLPR